MTRTFRRHGEAIRATLRDVEVELLRSARDQLRAALDSGDPDDPVLRRLFPAPVLGDEEVAAEVRDLLADQLQAQRVAQLDELLTILDRGQRSRGMVRVDLVDDEPLLVLGVLNDLRLAIGASIDVEALDRETIDEDHPHAYPLAVMDHLGMWQEQLLAIIDPESVRHATDGWGDVLDDLPDDDLADEDLLDGDDPDETDGGSR